MYVYIHIHIYILYMFRLYYSSIGLQGRIVSRLLDVGMFSLFILFLVWMLDSDVVIFVINFLDCYKVIN